jgi:hypothetical protein
VAKDERKFDGAQKSARPVSENGRRGARIRAMCSGDLPILGMGYSNVGGLTLGCCFPLEKNPHKTGTFFNVWMDKIRPQPFWPVCCISQSKTGQLWTPAAPCAQWGLTARHWTQQRLAFRSECPANVH